MAPCQNHAAMKFPSGAGTIRLAAFARQFVDVALDHRLPPKNYIQSLFQIGQMLRKSLAQSTELASLLFSLHVLFIYYMQIYEKQAINSVAYAKMLGKLRRRAELVRNYSRPSPLSEVQKRHAPGFVTENHKVYIFGLCADCRGQEAVRRIF